MNTIALENHLSNILKDLKDKSKIHQYSITQQPDNCLTIVIKVKEEKSKFISTEQI